MELKHKILAKNKKRVLLIWTLSYCDTPITEKADLGDNICWSLFVIL
jgi:hypothetical protein